MTPLCSQLFLASGSLASGSLASGDPQKMAANATKLQQASQLRRKTFADVELFLLQLEGSHTAEKKHALADLLFGFRRDMILKGSLSEH